MSESRLFTVLLADDVAALRKLVRLALESSGRFRVIAEAATGVEAIARSAEAKPDLVLLDLSMPELDGLEALPRVLEASPKSHVVVLSGFNHVRMAPVAKRLGASAYLEKGLDPEALARALLEVLEPGQAQAGNAARPPPGSMDLPPIVAPQLPPRGAAPPSTKPDPAGAGPRPFRVLLVESDPGRRSHLATLLDGKQGLGFDTHPASSLEDALERLQEGGIDLVVIDPEKAGSNPEDALIQVLSNTATTPVVALLSTHDAEMAASCVRLGVEDFLVLDELDADLLARSLRYALERRRAHEARRVVRAQQGELSRLRELELAKTRFFNAAAHEIGTPLTPIRLQIARLRKMLAGREDPGQERALDIIDRNVQRLAQLNQDILDVARLQAGRFSIDKHPMDLAVLVREAVESFEPLAEERGITLTTACPSGLVVDGDSARLSQVVYNLVANALKFTPRGGVVALEGRVAEGEAEVDVRDSGPGLAAEQIASLFQPFSQVLGDDQPRNVGTGLGLFVSRGIVELHGGRIWAQSPGHGKGSTFSVALPIRPLERSMTGPTNGGAKAA